MKRILACAGLCLVMVAAMGGPVFAADDNGAHDIAPYVTHWVITVLGMGVAARLAWQAFGRAVPVDNVPMFPVYMTSREQYRLGACAFAAFACGFFLLLVREHRQVLILAKPLDIIPESVMTAVSDRSAPYLVVIAAMGAVYLYLLTYEKPWNVLLMMRDVIQSWISVPQLAKRIMAQIRYSLHVPQDVISAVIGASDGMVTEQDFRKDPNTPDRKWAEACYMKWWLAQALDAGGDATFFTEESFGFTRLVDDFGKASSDMRRWKSGAVADVALAGLPQTVNDLHSRFSRLVACYLIYRYGSRNELCAEARKFGVVLPGKVSANPLRYWIVYVIALMASVYIGVYASAISYDVATGQGLNLAQDPDLALNWVMYSISNYGLAIIVILSLRMLAASLGVDAAQSHLVTYCWTFAVAFVVGPIGLTVAALLFAPSSYTNVPLYLLFADILKWGLGPALVCVYISYYLDRQTYADLPNIVHSARTIGWRLLNCFGFALITLIVLLPPLMAISRQGSTVAWSAEKLRFVASGATFFVALGLALAAQFALRASGEVRAVAPAPQTAS